MVEEVMGDLPVRAIWPSIHNDKSLWASMALFSRNELAHIDTIHSWVVAYSNDLWSNFLLSLAHINRFLISLNRYHV